MEFTEALQEFLFHQGFQRIKYDSKMNTKITLKFM